MKNLILYFLIFFFFKPAYSQHDFDSLYHHSPDFKIAVSSIKDTLDLFNSNDPLEIRIISDFKNLIKRKHSREYQQATFILKYNDTVNIKRDAKIKARGNYRLSNCSFPPIKINFKKSGLLSSKLSEFDKMKMVNNCRMHTSYEKYIIAEYLTYKMYNIITPSSFRVRLLKIVYIDTGRKNKSYTSHAFIIEPKEQLVERLNGIPIDKKGISLEEIDEVSENRMAIFQYMIGNTDFVISALHNVVLIKENSHLIFEPMVIPYDFDYSGLVNTPYAIPSEKLPIEKVTERLFLGACHNSKVFEESVAHFIDKKEALLQIVSNCPYLETNYKKQMEDYLNSFYNILDSKNGMIRTIMADCIN